MLWVCRQGTCNEIVPADISPLKLSEHMEISNNFSSEVTPTMSADWIEIDVGNPTKIARFTCFIAKYVILFPAKFGWDCGRHTSAHSNTTNARDGIESRPHPKLSTAPASPNNVHQPRRKDKTTFLPPPNRSTDRHILDRKFTEPLFPETYLP